MRQLHATVLTASLLWVGALSHAWSAPTAAPSPASSPPTRASERTATSPFADAPGKEKFPDASAIILKDDIQATINADGTSELVEYDAIKVLDRNGVERFGRTSRVYDSRTETLEVTEARVTSPSGQVTTVPASAVTDAVASGFTHSPLYQRLHMKTITFGEVAEGAVVEFKLTHRRRVPWPAKRFWEISYTQDFEPIVDTRFTLDTPDRLAVEIATPGMLGLQPDEVKRFNGRTVLRWHLENRPALAQEAAMPPLRQISTQIQVSSFTSWDDFATWARTVWEAALAPDAGITAKTAALVSRQTTDDGRIRAIMAWLDKEKPLAKGEVDLDTLPPATAAEAFKAVDLVAQDRAVLLAAMLRAANVRAYPALVATSDYGDPTRGTPSLQQFNRVLVAVATPAGWQWLDPAASAPGVLGPGRNDRPALVLNGQGQLTTTELTPPHANREEIRGVARLDTDGSMETRLVLTEHGANNILWRSMVNSTSQKEQQQVFQLIVANINPTAVLRDFYVPSSSDGPLQLTIGFEESRAGSRPSDGEGFQFAIPLTPQRRLISYAELPADRRKYPVVLGSTTYEERRLDIVIPSGWTVKTLPHSVTRSNTVGSLQIDVRADARGIHYFSRIVLRHPEVTLAQYPQLKELMDLMATATKERVVLIPPPTRSTPR
ncbi:MAG: DUF3857 domain-containing protein [Proteobacteria bacterium]|nr:DUF3857 domain-containing protein [Pseudomonadota bacterium]